MSPVSPGQQLADYVKAVQASSPAHYWQLSAPPPDMTASGTVTFAGTDPWSLAPVMHCDGTGGELIANTVEPPSSGAFTVEHWIRSSTAAQSGVTCLDLSNPTVPGTMNVEWGIHGNGVCRLYIAGGGNAGVGPVVTDGAWHHVVLSYDGTSTATVFKDGLQTATSTGIARTAATGYYWRIGRGVLGIYTGDVCHVATYNRALSAREVASHYNAGACNRAWLALGSNTILLDNLAAGWTCSSLDLGAPIIRAVSQDRPDADGAIDRTAYMGARTVTAAITVLDTMPGTATIDQIAASFAPYMVPSARPVLHYVLVRPLNPERTLTLRPANYDWPIVGNVQRDIALQWVAPDPVARDVISQSTTAFVGGPNGSITTAGDVGVKPVFTVTGPITAPRLTFTDLGTSQQTTFAFLSGYTLSAGQSITVDAAAHTVLMGTTSLLNQVDWTIANWPFISTNGAQFTLQGTGNTGATQAVATWNDGYLT